MSTMTPIKTAFSIGLIAMVLIGTTVFEQQLRLIFDFREIDLTDSDVESSESSPTKVWKNTPTEAVVEKTPAEIPMQQAAKHDTIKQGTAIDRINAMTAIEFEALDGIGPVIAARIVEDRRQQGNFTTLEDLKRVKGIGDKTYIKLLKALDQ